MALFDKSKTALVVIDLQKGIAGMDTVPHDSKTVIANAAKLADKFRSNGMLVILVHVNSTPDIMIKVECDSPMQWSGQRPADWADIVPELGPKESDVLVTKKQWGAFYGTDLELQLRRRGKDTMVLCGISTTHGVESTARFAYEYGFKQVFAEDAMSAMSQDQHKSTIENVLKRMGFVRSTQEILDSF